MAFAFMSFFVLLAVFCKVNLGSVIFRSEVIANLGEDAYINCRLTQPKDVVQVIWQKDEMARKRENVGTLSKRFSTFINGPYMGKVEFVHPGLENCSIIIRNVSREDESCYSCVFMTYPDEVITGRTCLKVNELYKPKLLVTKTNSSSSDFEVTCSVTGRPAPTVKWDDSAHLPLLNSSSNHFPHPNGMVTVTLTAKVSVANLRKDTLVTCLVSQNSKVLHRTASWLNATTGQDSLPRQYVDTERNISYYAVIIAVAPVLVLVVLTLFFLRRRNDGTKRNLSSTISEENVCTPLKMAQTTPTSCSSVQRRKTSCTKPKDSYCARKISLMENRSQSLGSSANHMTPKELFKLKCARNLEYEAESPSMG